ncbi:MAG: SagB/ThcOx family dehydrogenase [Candidatus Aenigmarchaeota archaeon]|nr:SagB/ThcOx family dehydrogenase [Candidatus Aenigmarchaeota archaeon]
MKNKHIERFYRGVKLTRAAGAATDVVDPPVTYTQVFYKEYPRFPSVELPDVTPCGEFDTLLEGRHSERSFADIPVSLDELSRILFTCRIVDRVRDPEKRTYPSAGARFPIEIYPIVFNVDGLERGAYHYDMPRHRLEILLEQDLRDRETEIVSPYLSNTAAALVLTAVLARSEVKYGNKAYPYSLIEAGHIGQNIQLACAKYDIGCCPIGGFVNDAVSEILDLTEDEIPLYVFGTGKSKLDDDEATRDSG